MRFRNLTAIAFVSILSFANMGAATADSAKTGQSMTHMKTAAGVLLTLEAAGVVVYVQGGATASIIGDSISSANGQIVFHIPVTANNMGMQHKGSNIVFFNTTNNMQLVLRNPVIDIGAGEVKAIVPQAGDQTLTIFKISNSSILTPKMTNDRKGGLRTTAYKDASLVLAPGIAATIATTLGLPANTLPEGLAFGSTDVTIYSKISKSR